jgi:hypothetical protein
MIGRHEGSSSRSRQKHIGIGQTWDIDHENLINTYSLDMLKSHTHAEISHREHSRYQPNLHTSPEDSSVSTYNFSRVMLGIISNSRLYDPGSSSGEIGDRRLDVCSMKVEIPEVQDLVCVIPFVLSGGVFRLPLSSSVLCGQ